MNYAISGLRRFFYASFHRRSLDRLQKRYRDVYRGVVLDIGGREGGSFDKPKARAAKWIFADVEAKHRPDLVVDVSDMRVLEDGAVDVISVVEVFEHVTRPEAGLRECHRVLRKGGTLVLSSPFLFPVHPDPGDDQRWTLERWRRELARAGFEITVLEITGGFFAVLANFLKLPLTKIRKYYQPLFLPCHLVLEIIYLLDKVPLVSRISVLRGFDDGYFAICRKR